MLVSVVAEADPLQSSSGAASSSDPMPAPVAEVDAAPVAEAPEAKTKRLVEDHEVIIELVPGRYERAMVKCTFHKGCKAQRAYSDKYARASRLGIEEPFCFLGVWLKRGRELKAAEEHQDLGRRLPGRWSGPTPKSEVSCLSNLWWIDSLHELWVVVQDVSWCHNGVGLGGVLVAWRTGAGCRFVASAWVRAVMQMGRRRVDGCTLI